MSYTIEVATEQNTSSTERGRILERFARRFLETQNFTVKEEIRVTASEVDLLGTENTTGERIFVECKAHRSTIPSEVLQKLLGNVVFKNYSAGWLISTYSLSKDAKGFEDEWNQKDPTERRKLRIYPPDRLAERLIRSKTIVSPSTLSFDREQFKVANEAILLLTQYGEFWALPVLDIETSIRIAAILFNAASGEYINDQHTLDLISKTDSSMSLPLITNIVSSQKKATSKLNNELESIVGVPVADHWADYRPARPEDFIGRESVQSTIFNFFDKVRTRNTSTRIIALRAPSGWGKSSTLLKIASRAANIRNKGKYYIFTVDSRAAATRRFPELAIVTGIKKAIDRGFIDAQQPIEFGGISNLFSTPSMQDICENLQNKGRVLCIFFDQFEELLSKSDLVDVFDEMRRICTAIEEAQANIVVGFSWKTDGVIPTDHKAYHMWHLLADRRYEIELTPFSEKEVTIAINRFEKELESKLIPQLRRVLQDHCQGFPWLLKKLCVHILDLISNGIDQYDVLSSSMNIQTLFKKDLEHLSAGEAACIKQIATESPAEFFKIVQIYGDTTVTALINKRLIIRSGTRLTIYWDIFRDYILTEKIPDIPVTYVPQADLSKYARALAYLTGKTETTYNELASQMNLGMGATDNLVRDLVNMGHADAHRKEHRITPTFSTKERAFEIIYVGGRAYKARDGRVNPASQ